jgi:hypothetical protein
MRAETDRAKLEALMTALGRAVHGPLCPLSSTQGGAQSPAPVFLNPGRGTVLCARQILADGGDAVPPMPLAEHRTPLCPLCLCGETNNLRAPDKFLRTAGTPSLPMARGGRGAVPCARCLSREGHGPPCPPNPCGRRGRRPSHAFGGTPHPSVSSVSLW